MCVNQMASSVNLWCVCVVVAAWVAPSAALAGWPIGGDLPPGGTVAVAGVSGGSGPGTVVHDGLIPFEIRDLRGVLMFRGNLQDRVVRNNATGTLSFERRIRDTDQAGSLNGVVVRLACSDFSSFLTVVGYSTTGLGSVAPNLASRTPDGAVVTYHFDSPPLFIGQESRFVFAKTEALDFAATGQCVIGLQTGDEVAIPVVSPVRVVDPGCRRIGFEDVASGTTFPAGASFASNGVLLHLNEFYWGIGSCTNPTMSGFARIANNGQACGTGNELMISNVNVELDYGVPLTGLMIRFGEYGGNINLQINGQCISVPNFSDLPMLVGGVSVLVDEPVPGQGCGTIMLEGDIGSLSLGGQELWIDDIECIQNVCVADKTPPVAELTDPRPMACVCDPVEIFGTATDDNFDRYRLEYRAVTNPVWTTITMSTTPVLADLLGVWNTTGLAQGRYLIRLTVQDACGHTETAVNFVWLSTRFDNLTVREPDPGEVVSGNVCIDGTVWDSFCFNDYTVDYQPAGALLWSPVDPAQPVYTSTVVNDPFAHWNTVGLGIPDGAYTLLVAATDDCGNSASELVDVIVDNTPPVALISDPTPCSYVEGIVVVTGTANDANMSHWVLQYTGGDSSEWVTISSSEAPVINGVLGEWDTSLLRSCAYTLRLVVWDTATLNCNHTSHHRSEYEVSVNVGACGDFDTDDDGDVDLFDYHWFEKAFTGALP